MIATLLLNLYGYGIFAALMYAIMKANARRWNRLAREYRADRNSGETIACCATRNMQTVILVGGQIGCNSYQGIVTVGVTEQGILLRVMRPFGFFHPPLLIPFGDCRIEPRRWYLFGKTSQLTLARVSDVQMIVHDDLLQWIESQVSSLAVAAG